MFYSHTILARKGPLGTVWCAAHLQHKLKKTHYINTNVPSTVERIMYPEVPIALRMSGHLLLGVVRIYSKQVDYLFEDCNVIRITINRVFTSVNVNLPDDATHATFHSVTLPERFELDAMELDDYYNDMFKDSHLKSKNEITLTDQIPTGRDPFIVISVDEHELRPSLSLQENSGSGPVPMEEDVPPTVEVDTDAGFEDVSPSNNQFGPDDRSVRSSSPRDLPSIEMMRDARHGFDFNNSPILPDRAEPDKFLEEQINRDLQTSSPVIEEVVMPDVHPSSPRNHEEPHSFGHVDSPILFAHRSPEMEIPPTPPVEQPIVRRRKRKLPFDKSTALSNQHMKNALNDTSGIKRVKRNCPCSSLAVWKVKNRLRLKKDGIFIEPFTTGSCAELQDIYKEDAVSSKPHLVNTERTDQETNSDQEIEIMRDNNECGSSERQMPDFSTAMPSPNERSFLTPEKSNLGFLSERQETNDGDGIFSTPLRDMGGSSGNLDLEMRTPDTFLRTEHTALSDIPELMASPGELGFLEQDDNSTPGSQGTPESGFTKTQGTPEVQALSSRARALVQYLKRKSSVNPMSSNSEESSGGLSLKKILEGKSRKISARMFFETLVLKNCGFVDVNQEKSYDDITLKVNSLRNNSPAENSL